MKTIKIFTGVIWCMVCLYISTFLIEMMNIPDTISFDLGILGILLLIFLTIKTRVGTKYIKLKIK